MLGRDGIPIPGFGLAGRTSRSALALESAGLAVLDGAGVTGDSIGMVDTQFTAGAGTTPEAGRFTTEAISTELDPEVAADLTGHEAEFTIIPGQFPGLSTGIARLLEDTPSTEIPKLTGDTRIEDTQSTATRAAPAPMPSAVTTMAVRPGAFRRVEARASVVEADFTVVEAEDFTVAGVVAGAGDRGFRQVS